MNKINKHYTQDYDEDIRLKKDLMHRPEYLLTFEKIIKYLKPNMKILELGAGTGAYSIQLAKEGYNVTAIEYVEKNYKILKSKIKKNMNINVIHGDATNLNILKNKKFDLILCLGPMYHLNNQGRIKCLKESINVCKKNGIIICAFISNNLVMVDKFKNHIKYLMNNKERYNSNFKFKDDIFTLVSINDIEKLFNKFNLKKLEMFSPDGISRLLKNEINNFNKKEFELWLNYLRKTGDDPSLIGYGEHILYIAKK